ncbi:hypothetical protein AX17_000587 [Amanita inopinata Kibby_2008]|nr:hypothetical protein AX17_000587 [Amanita inopinata Kibby_2008]
MSGQGPATEQLLELLLQLKKTTPAAAKQILNAQPSIAYALITLMVSMNAIHIDVFHKTLAEYSTNIASAAPQIAPAPAPALPPHLIQSQPQYRNSTPPTGVSPVPSIAPSYPNGTGPAQSYPNAYGQPSQQVVGPGYAGYSQPGSGYPQYPHYGGQQHVPTPPPSAPPALPESLANIPEDQKAIIVRVLSMTPEQINMLNPTERATYIQLVRFWSCFKC